MFSTKLASAALLLCSISTAVPTADPEAAAQASRFQYYDMPTSLSGPCDLTTGPDGAIWVQDFLVNKIARIDPKTNAVTEYDIPYRSLPLNITLPGEAPGRTGLTACAIQPGEDGNLYAASGVRNEFLKIVPSTGEITVFDGPGVLGNLQPLNDLWRGPTGMFFSQTTANKITHFDYKSHEFTSWTVPTLLSTPVGIIVAADGAVWFCEFTADKIGRLNATTGQITEYPTQTQCVGPAVIRAQTRENGRYILYYTCFVGNGIGSIDILSGETKFYPGPTIASLPTEDTVDSFGKIWYSTASANVISRLDPKTGAVKVIEQPDGLIVAPTPLPAGLPPALNIAIHYGPKNSIWFTEVARNRVGKYQLKNCGRTINPCTEP